MLIEHADGRILWDTSCPRDWRRRWQGTSLDELFPYDRVADGQYLDDRLDALGLELGDVDIVVASHLHMDHAGNVRRLADAGCELLVHELELEGATAFRGRSLGAHVKQDYEGLPWKTVRGDAELARGVHLLEAPGHSFGNMALLLELERDQSLLFAGDALMRRENVGPPLQPGVTFVDLTAWLRSAGRLVEIARDRRARLVCGHDAADLCALTGTSSYS